jgi:hypothetical protein
MEQLLATAASVRILKKVAQRRASLPQAHERSQFTQVMNSRDLEQAWLAAVGDGPRSEDIREQDGVLAP